MTPQTAYEPVVVMPVDEPGGAPRSQYPDAAWAARIRGALDEQRLELASQPILPLTGGAAREELALQVAGGDGQCVPVEEFLLAARRYGLVAHLDRWVLAKAARCAAVGQIVHAKLSASAIQDPFIIDHLAHELSAAGAPAASIVVEVPARALTSSADGGEAFAAELHALGCGLALYDAAARMRPGQLERLRLKALIIPRDLVRDLLRSAHHAHRAHAIVAVGRSIGVETVADGVDDRETLALLRGWGVDYARGALISDRTAPAR